MNISRDFPRRGLILAAVMLLPFAATSCSNDNDGDGSFFDRSTPTVSSTYPINNATDVPVNHKITATFSEPMDPATIDDVSFTAVGADEPALIGAVTLDAETNTATFTPNSHFTSKTIYTATVTTAAESSNGVPLDSDYTWVFTTGTETDSTAPEVISTNPADASTDIAINSKVSVTFSENMDPTSVNTDTFMLAPSSDLTAMVEGTVSLNATGTTAKLQPANNLNTDTDYTATVTTGVTDTAVPPNALASDYVWSFITGTSERAGPDPVLLGTAGDFVILTKTGITNVPPSPITGNIGASPITAAAMDDVTCAEMTDTIYGADNAYTGSGDTSCFLGDSAANTRVDNAVLDMGIAYTDAAGRSSPDFTELHAGDLSGQTLEPGLYKWGTGVLISTDMTFDGDPNDVWILQVAGDLTVASGASMTLAGGAEAKNIFWQIGGSSGAIINTDAHVSGILLAEKAITLATGTSVDGRLLSQTEVTLQQNDVTQPAP
ncbi:ice-binding family protein [Thiohalophilus sp.]|uniref:ice-binding family protein n=1 Tax=Thiohalophilus sp. TaxID=3028392 RepID=UPI002ACDDFAE|nr:ice-binding family protein [Thiohalophilus sp.]MDZ7661823.1 ice-binding family protein [Thiohalophilus sp.]